MPGWYGILLGSGKSDGQSKKNILATSLDIKRTCRDAVEGVILSYIPPLNWAEFQGIIVCEAWTGNRRDSVPGYTKLYIYCGDRMTVDEKVKAMLNIEGTIAFPPVGKICREEGRVLLYFIALELAITVAFCYTYPQCTAHTGDLHFIWYPRKSDEINFFASPEHCPLSGAPSFKDFETLPQALSTKTRKGTFHWSAASVLITYMGYSKKLWLHTPFSHKTFATFHTPKNCTSVEMEQQEEQHFPCLDLSAAPQIKIIFWHDTTVGKTQRRRRRRKQKWEWGKWILSWCGGVWKGCWGGGGSWFVVGSIPGVSHPYYYTTFAGGCSSSYSPFSKLPPERTGCEKLSTQLVPFFTRAIFFGVSVRN